MVGCFLTGNADMIDSVDHIVADSIQKNLELLVAFIFIGIYRAYLA
jgi:hypothetical protein